MPVRPQRMSEAELCGKWMPKAKAFCARGPGHNGPCMSPASMARNRKYRITSYGITLDDFARLLKIQQDACGMCHEPFDEGQLIHVDHDHACCPEKNRSCGKCVRGLLCHACNVALGHIERKYDLARAFLDSPPFYIGSRGG